MTKDGVSEKTIENQCLAWLKANQVFGFKVRSTGTFDPKTKRFRARSMWFRPGCPDIVCCYKGRFVGLEVKTPKGRVSEDQLSFHKDIVANGGAVYVVRSVDELDQIFNSLDGNL